MQLTKIIYDIQGDALQSIERSGIDLNSLKGKTVLITGGTGFFGIWLLTCLVNIKEKIGGDLELITISRNPENFISKIQDKKIIENVEIIRGDIKAVKLINKNITHLVHMATTNAAETFGGHDQLDKIDLLYEGTKNILNQCGTKLEKVLFTSSGVAYGVNNNSKILENDFTGPNTIDIDSALGIGKLSAEYLIAYFAKKYGYKYSIARCFSFAGQYLPMDLHYAFGNFIDDYLNSKNIRIKGDGQDMRSYLYIGDAIAWLLKLIEEPNNDIFNIGSENEIKIEDLAKKIASHKDGMKIHIEGISKQIDNFKRSTYIPCTNKIKSRHPHLMEWTPLDEIIRKMIDCRI